MRASEPKESVILNAPVERLKPRSEADFESRSFEAPLIPQAVSQRENSPFVSAGFPVHRAEKPV